MASIERTAYPRLKQKFTGEELSDFYTPTLDNLHFVRENSRKSETALHLIAQLKTFERLGYFPKIEDIPESLLKHLRSTLELSNAVLPLVDRNTSHHQQLLILNHLRIKKYDKSSII